MKTVQYLGNSKVKIQDAARPTLDENSVIVKVQASAICGSELNAFRGPYQEGFHNAGHEVVGIIDDAPPTSVWRPGMQVGARVVQGCGCCYWCEQGYETACLSKRLFTRNGHSEYFKLGMNGIQPIPEAVTWPAAAVLTGDGLGVPVRVARRLGSTEGRKVLVLGLGPIGLGCVLVQAHRGAEVMGADLSEYRVKLARELGAVESLNAQSADLQASVSDWTGGRGADVVILAAGNEQALITAMELVRRQGTVFQAAELEKATIHPSAAFIGKEITITGSWYYTSEDWKEMLALHDQGLPYDRLVTHVFDLDQAQEAYDLFAAAQTGKVILRYN
jgi:threonine dehydrogenase-like Zn-dependent dehydrogenase